MSLLDEARAVRERIAARLRELEPLVAEYNELRRVAAEMGIEGADAPPASGAPREATTKPVVEDALSSTPAPPPRSRSTARQAASGRPPSAGGGAAPGLRANVLGAVQAQPGLTVAEYARALDVPPAALYRPVRELGDDGLIVRRSRQLFPA